MPPVDRLPYNDYPTRFNDPLSDRPLPPLTWAAPRDPIPSTNTGLGYIPIKYCITVPVFHTCTYIFYSISAKAPSDDSSGYKVCAYCGERVPNAQHEAHEVFPFLIFLFDQLIRFLDYYVEFAVFISLFKFCVNYWFFPGLTSCQASARTEQSALWSAFRSLPRTVQSFVYL